MKNLIEKIKKIWNNDSRDILVPMISVIIFIVASLTVGFVKAFIILILINSIYFGINHFSKNNKKNNSKKKNKKKKKGRKKLKIILLILLTFFILSSHFPFYLESCNTYEFLIYIIPLSV